LNPVGIDSGIPCYILCNPVYRFGFTQRQVSYFGTAVSLLECRLLWLASIKPLFWQPPHIDLAIIFQGSLCAGVTVVPSVQVGEEPTVNAVP